MFPPFSYNASRFTHFCRCTRVKTSIFASYLFLATPQWRTEPKDVSVSAGHSLRVECSATGFPTPNVSWRKSGKVLLNRCAGALHARLSTLRVFLSSQSQRKTAARRKLLPAVVPQYLQSPRPASKQKEHTFAKRKTASALR